MCKILNQKIKTGLKCLLGKLYSYTDDIALIVTGGTWDLVIQISEY